MTVYMYRDKQYNSLWELRMENPDLIFYDEAPEELFNEMGITFKDIPDPTPTQESAKDELDNKLMEIDRETSQKIMDGFDYEYKGTTYHFSYDNFDQQNFVDTANACLMYKQGVQGLPDDILWNAYDKDGNLVRVKFNADEFIALYAGGALAHKSKTMAEGSAKKEAITEEFEAKAKDTSDTNVENTDNTNTESTNEPTNGNTQNTNNVNSSENSDTSNNSVNQNESKVEEPV